MFKAHIGAVVGDGKFGAKDVDDVSGKMSRMVIELAWGMLLRRYRGSSSQFFTMIAK